MGIGVLKPIVLKMLKVTRGLSAESEARNCKNQSTGLSTVYYHLWMVPDPPVWCLINKGTPDLGGGGG